MSAQEAGMQPGTMILSGDPAEQSVFTQLLYKERMQRDFTSAMLVGDTFERAYRIAEVMATGKTTVPRHLQGNIGDCMAIVLQAMQWGMNHYAVAQKTHLVNGVLGYEAQLVAAVINNSGVTKDRFKIEWFGDWKQVGGKFVEKPSRNNDGSTYRAPGWSLKDEEGLGCRVSATLKGETEPRVRETLLVQARTRNSTLWADDPQQQLAYLCQKKWARLYAPDVILGVYTADELAFDGDPNEPVGEGEGQQTETKVKTTQRKAKEPKADAAAPPPAPAPGPAAPPAGAPAPGPADTQTTAAPPPQAPAAATPPPPAAASTIDAGMVKYLERKISAMDLGEETISKMFERLGFPGKAVKDLTPDEFTKVKVELSSLE